MGSREEEPDGWETRYCDLGVVLEHGEEVEADWVDEGGVWVCGDEAEDGEDEGDDGRGGGKMVRRM